MEYCEIPSLISLILEQIAKSYPVAFETMRFTISSEIYGNIASFLNKMEFCPQCDNWVSGYRSNGQCYHFVVNHKDLLPLPRCHCGYCLVDSSIRYEVRSVPCIRCRKNYHYQEDNAGKYCDTRVRNEPNVLESGAFSNTWKSKYLLTARTPISILNWSQYSKGHSLCDFCIRDMLSLGQLRKQYITLESMYIPSYCDGCGLSISSRDPWYPNRNIQSIVHITNGLISIDRSETCLDCMFVSRRFRLNDNIDPHLVNNLVNGSLLCNECFCSIQNYLQEVSQNHHHPL